MGKIATGSTGRALRCTCQSGPDGEGEELGAKEQGLQQLGYRADVNYSIIDPNLR